MKKANNLFNAKMRFNRDSVLASLAAASMTFCSAQAFGTEICSLAPVGIPATIDGLYLNFVTGASNTTGSVAGWDFNVFASGLATLNFFSSNSTLNTTRYVGAGATVDVLAAGTIIDATSILSSAGVSPGGAFGAGVTHGYVGVAFTNEAAAITNYGWVSLTTTGPNGFPATINQFCYQNDGSGIFAGGELIFVDGFET
ncbi:MAG: hypothetical protein ABIR62_17910 [Dokdonella sp.]|uniref:hypothetical protein n=1 Tax=Dokdonella sp. TaxID=2291710 RepID=UPI003263A211